MARGYRAAEILEALAAAKAEAGGPVDLELHAAWLQIQAGVEHTVRVPEMSTVTARERLEAGEPLTSGSVWELGIATDTFTALGRSLAAGAAERRPDLAALLSAAVSAHGGLCDAAGPGASVRASSPGRVAARVLLPILLAHTVRAFLRPVAAGLAGLVDDGVWGRGRCPVCGGAPDLAAVGALGERRLLCGRCDAEWAYRAIGCPYCEAEDPRSLGYHPAGVTGHRLYVCDACQTYLKAVEAPADVRRCLPLDRILSAPLDCAAVQAGYREPLTSVAELLDPRRAMV